MIKLKDEFRVTITLERKVGYIFKNVKIRPKITDWETTIADRKLTVTFKDGNKRTFENVIYLKTHDSAWIK